MTPAFVDVCGKALADEEEPEVGALLALLLVLVLVLALSPATANAPIVEATAGGKLMHRRS